MKRAFNRNFEPYFTLRNIIDSITGINLDISDDAALDIPHCITWFDEPNSVPTSQSIRTASMRTIVCVMDEKSGNAIWFSEGGAYVLIALNQFEFGIDAKNAVISQPTIH